MRNGSPSASPAADGSGQGIDPGFGPPWEVAELPAAPPYSLRNVFRVIGPGAILLATSIGGGEWLVGPAQAVKHGVSLFWVATVAIVLQVVFNLEAVRYTLYTGEPIYGGLLRLWPGPRLWAPFYSVAAFLQLGWPALAGLGAATLFSASAGRLPDGAQPGDQLAIWVITALLLLAVVAILSFGGTIERMLERASWVMVALIFGYLVLVNVLVVPLDHWLASLAGFAGLSPRPAGDIDWDLLGALAATAGSGGIANLTVTNWIRDKGLGMGALVGAIPSAVGSSRVTLSAVGRVFPVGQESLARWRSWMRYVVVDQVWVWGLFCFVGMFLNVNLATAVIPPGTDLTGLAAGANQARYLADALGAPFWFLTLATGFWIVFSTQLGNTDVLVRTVTDVLWLGSARARRGGVLLVYYSILAAVTLWGLSVLWLAGAAQLFQILANIAGLILAIAAFQILRVNRRFLPRALRPPLWREALLLACGGFYWFFCVRWFLGFAGIL